MNLNKYLLHLGVPDRPDSTSNLASNLKLFIKVFVGVFLPIAVIVFILPQRYESRMKFLVKNERPDLVVSAESDNSGTRAAELSETRVNSEIELLKSADVLKQVVLATELAHQVGTVEAAGGASPLMVDRAIRQLDKQLNVEAVKRSDIIDVSFRAKNAELAQAVLNRLADTYLSTHLKAHASPGTFTFFDDQAKAYREQLSISEEKLKEFRQRYAVFVDPEQKDLLTKRAIEAQAALEDTDAQAADYGQQVTAGQNRIDKLEPRVTSDIRTSPQSGLVQQLSGMLADLENRRTQLATKFKAKDRLVVELDQEIADTTSALKTAQAEASVEKVTGLNQIRLEAEKNLVNAKVLSAGLYARRKRLITLSELYKSRLLAVAGATTESENLIRLVKENEDNYLLYAKKREEARIAESLDQQRITNVAVVESPTLPVEPVSPKIPLDLMMGALLATLVAFLSVKGVDYMQSTRQLMSIAPSLPGEVSATA